MQRIRVNAVLFLALSTAALAQQQEPIVTFGHGGFFGPDGKQIPVTLDFVQKAQAYYKAKLVAALPDGKKKDFTTYEGRVMTGLNVSGQDKLLLEHQSIEWLIANTTSPQVKLQSVGKLRALRQAMESRLPQQATLAEADKKEPYTPSPQVQQRLASPQLRLMNSNVNLKLNAAAGKMRSATINSGQAYLNECSAAGVPIPPSINVMDPNGTAGWKSQGFIPQASQFIVGSPAELRSYKSAAPEGMCFALPRYNAAQTTVNLDGVICMGKQSSKVCFWDNQMAPVGSPGQGAGFSFPAGTQIPIGKPAAPGGLYQGGGAEIEFGSGGVCTDCHAGENPYIIHPNVNLASGGPAVQWRSLSQAPQNLPTMPVNRYDPLVGASWPQNQSSQVGSTLPAACSGCHVKGSAGRFPHLSNLLPGYCSVVLTQAITATMPQGSPGTAIAAGNAFRDMWCNAGPNAASEDTGDPHLTTINNVHYDFQAAGEFTALRNVDSDFELQTRQSPVLTTFTPGANPYTGLASCVSLNTAAALRAGKRRVTFQTSGTPEKPGRYELRVDGKVVTGKFDLGGGNQIVSASPGGQAEVQLSDGTRIVITPIFWSSQGYWYLQVEAFNTPAREGIMGPILSAADWLPRGPDGMSFGSRPPALLDRWVSLNQKFANAWRVKPTTSLFVYPAGMSTADFTDVNWPSEPGKGCMATTVKGPKPPVIREPQPEVAKKACTGIKDKAALENCIFDVTVMGDTGVAKAYQAAEKLKAAASK